ncbi:hypothetical protein [Candidatus Cytomitobacter primus]|uniref:Uncharacterized protein n=1 Tax=Candidatus Cytomitobacter primus TaxID=2066024 RepID=A0A5C0UFC8_9PROT|nr:hypothetical protein [Candidatus Cytomitobacter primus]QEK38343.1 hypothetical protein FZC34_00165 [Candidatus Cytomitobacter primus]
MQKIFLLFITSCMFAMPTFDSLQAHDEKVENAAANSDSVANDSVVDEQQHRNSMADNSDTDSLYSNTDTFSETDSSAYTSSESQHLILKYSLHNKITPNAAKRFGRLINREGENREEIDEDRFAEIVYILQDIECAQRNNIVRSAQYDFDQFINLKKHLLELHNQLYVLQDSEWNDRNQNHGDSMLSSDELANRMNLIHEEKLESDRLAIAYQESKLYCKIETGRKIEMFGGLVYKYGLYDDPSIGSNELIDGYFDLYENANRGFVCNDQVMAWEQLVDRMNKAYQLQYQIVTNKLIQQLMAKDAQKQVIIESQAKQIETQSIDIQGLEIKLQEQRSESQMQIKMLKTKNTKQEEDIKEQQKHIDEIQPKMWGNLYTDTSLGLRLLVSDGENLPIEFTQKFSMSSKASICSSFFLGTSSEKDENTKLLCITTSIPAAINTFVYKGYIDIYGGLTIESYMGADPELAETNYIEDIFHAKQRLELERRIEELEDTTEEIRLKKQYLKNIEECKLKTIKINASIKESKMEKEVLDRFKIAIEMVELSEQCIDLPINSIYHGMNGQNDFQSFMRLYNEYKAFLNSTCGMSMHGRVMARAVPKSSITKELYNEYCRKNKIDGFVDLFNKEFESFEKSYQVTRNNNYKALYETLNQLRQQKSMIDAKRRYGKLEQENTLRFENYEKQLSEAKEKEAEYKKLLSSMTGKFGSIYNCR